MKPLEARIFELYDRLAESERRLADVVLEHQRDLASYSATELAARAMVSKATAARLFRRLGYKNYIEAKQQNRSLKHWGSPLNTIESNQHGDTNLLVHGRQELRNISLTVENCPPASASRAIEILSSAGTVWLVGLRNSYALAHLARFWLSIVRPRVELFPVGGLSFAEDVVQMAPGDALFAIGFRRRPRVLRLLMEKARERGLDVVFLTDFSASTTAKSATVVLRCHSQGSYLFDSYTAAVSMINYLGSSVATRLAPNAMDRISEIDRLHDELDTFTTPAVPSRGRNRKVLMPAS